MQAKGIVDFIYLINMHTREIRFDDYITQCGRYEPLNALKLSNDDYINILLDKCQGESESESELVSVEVQAKCEMRMKDGFTWTTR